MALAAAPDATRLRGEIARSLLDLLHATRTDRLLGVRDLAARAAEMVRAAGGDGRAAGPPGRGKARGRGAAAVAAADPAEADAGADPADVADQVGPARVPAAERRAAALALVAIWRDLARDLALVGLDAPSRARDPELIEDLDAARRRIEPALAGEHLRSLELAGERLEGNVSPELVLDGLALAWGR
jgi:hypothetical protein